MDLFVSPSAPRAPWLVLAALVTGCVQVTDFEDLTAGSDGSTSSPSEPQSTGAADESSTSSGETSDAQPGPGDSSWLRLGSEAGTYHGVARRADGSTRVLGEEEVRPQGQSDPYETGALDRKYGAGGEVDDFDTYTYLMGGWENADSCERPDGSAFVGSFIETFEEHGFFPMVTALDSEGAIAGAASFGVFHSVEGSTMTATPRVVCDTEGRGWLALSYRDYMDEARVSLARFDPALALGWDSLSMYEASATETRELLGLGRDALGNIHLGIRTGVDPSSGETLVLLESVDADGTPRPGIELDGTELPGAQPVGFAARDSRVVVAMVDPELELTWIVAYDVDGAEQWRTSVSPGPAQGWEPGPVGLAEDGSVVLTASVGGEHLGLLELDDGGVLRWSTEHPFAADGQPQLGSIEITDLDVGPDTVDVVGSVSDGGSRVGWIRRVLR